MGFSPLDERNRWVNLEPEKDTPEKGSFHAIKVCIWDVEGGYGKYPLAKLYDHVVMSGGLNDHDAMKNLAKELRRIAGLVDRWLDSH